MEALRSWRGRHTLAGTIATLILLAIMFETIWTGESGDNCKSMLQDDVHIGIVH